eukprot:3900964-Rhodomonas_salina.1
MAAAVETLGGRPRGVWRPLQHEFVSVELDPRVLAAIRADLLLRAGNGYHNPETTPDSPDKVLRSTFRRLTRREPSRSLVAVAQAALKRPA